MAEEAAETVLCLHRVVEGKQDALLELCREHDRVLRRLGLCRDEPATTLYRGQDGPGRWFIVVAFDWKNAAAVEAAHHHPEVQKIWEAMEPLCEERDGRPGMEFPHVQRVVL